MGNLLSTATWGRLSILVNPLHLALLQAPWIVLSVGQRPSKTVKLLLPEWGKGKGDPIERKRKNQYSKVPSFLSDRSV